MCPEVVEVAGRSSRQDGGGPRWQRAPIIGASLVVGAVAALAPLLDRYSMWRDEALTAKLMTGSFLDLVHTLHVTVKSESAQPLYYLVLWPWSRVFGRSEVAFRVPSLLAMVAATWVLGRVLMRLGAGRHSLAAWSLLVLPVTLWYSLEARPYALIVLLVSLHLLESLRVLQDDSRSLAWLALLTLLVMAAYSVAGCAALVAFGGVAWSRFRSRSEAGRRETPGTLLFEGLAVGASLVLVAFSLSKSGVSGVPLGRSRPLSLAYAGYELLTGRSIAFSVAELRAGSLVALVRDHPLDDLALALVAGVFVVLGFRSWKGLRGTADRKYISLVAPWIVGALAFALYAVATKFPLVGRHLLFALPAVYVVLAGGLAARPPVERVAAGTALVLVGALALGGIVLTNRYDKDDFRGLAVILHRCQLSPANTVVAAPVDGLSYYDAAFTDVPVSGVEVAVDRVARGDSDAAVVDVNHDDPKGQISSRIVRAANLEVLELADLRIVSRRPLQACAQDRIKGR